jgi:hypothetical protein
VVEEGGEGFEDWYANVWCVCRSQVDSVVHAVQWGGADVVRYKSAGSFTSIWYI